MLRQLRKAIVSFLQSVRLIPVGKPNDGVDQPLFSSGTEIDKSWADLHDEILESRDAWRQNPYARRITGLTTAYVVGTDMAATTTHDKLKPFIDDFWSHEQNKISLRLEEWSDELSRAGELFITLHPNPINGMPQVRTIPASRIRQVKCKEGDYETEIAYRELPYQFGESITTSPNYLEEKWWFSPEGIELRKQAGEEVPREEPWMLHYTVNKPIGAIRGESDLAPILIWLRRYNTWLEDRIRLNAAVRAFLWIVHAPDHIRDVLQERYIAPPEGGRIIFADPEEEWKPVTPNLQARDASADGRAIRWMIAAGGPGTSLTDFGETEDSNLATARAGAEQRRRFLLRRQSYFAWTLQDIITKSYNRMVEHQNGAVTPDMKVKTSEVHIVRPDIAVEDNFNTAQALMALAESFINTRNVMGISKELSSLFLRMFLRYGEEKVSEKDFQKIIDGKPVPDMMPQQGMRNQQSGEEESSSNKSKDKSDDDDEDEDDD